MSVPSATGAAPQPPWWRRAVVYQAYVRSFADANGDGTGDIPGLASRLPYLRDLGVDAVWINPWYRSPLHDGGYDVADYRDIDPRYGTLADAERLVRAAHEHGLRVIADLVPNHTSSEHAWFREARSAPPGHPSRARYLIRPGRGRDGADPPNDWSSVFGGGAWKRLPDGEWFLHLFDETQPDLDWTHPEVRAEFEAILRFWLDRGIDGFRVDVAHGLAKAPGLPDLAASRRGAHPYWDRDELHEIVRSWRATLDGYAGERMMVAEAWVRPERLPLYLRPDEYHQSFNFQLLGASWNAKSFRDVIDSALRAARDVGSTPTWVLSNHDVVRHATRYGLPADTDTRAWVLDGPHGALDEARGLRRARAAILVLLALPGSAYLYQGEELGLGEVYDLPEDVLDDPVWEQSGHRRKGRDGCRVPLPWTPEPPALGFSEAEPWLPQPERFAALAASVQQGDPYSTFSLYREALRLRRRWLVDDEDLEWLDLGDDVLAFRRASGALCVANFGESAVGAPSGDPLLCSARPTRTTVEPDSAIWLVG